MVTTVIAAVWILRESQFVLANSVSCMLLKVDCAVPWSLEYFLMKRMIYHKFDCQWDLSIQQYARNGPNKNRYEINRLVLTTSKQHYRLRTGHSWITQLEKYTMFCSPVLVILPPSSFQCNRDFLSMHSIPIMEWIWEWKVGVCRPGYHTLMITHCSLTWGRSHN